MLAADLAALGEHGPRVSAGPVVVEVSLVDLDARRERLLAEAGCLSAAERAEADRFRSDLQRCRYLGSHVFLRQTLAHALGCRPADVALERGRWGKPRLAGGGDGLRFNLAHAGRVAVVATAGGAGVGIDIERLRPGFEWNEVADRLLSPAEREVWVAGSPGPESFCRLWTRKEASAKATGAGLSLDPRRVAVGFAAADGWRPIHLLEPARSQWLLDLPLPTPWFGALAVERVGADGEPPVWHLRRSPAGAPAHG
jgi:4'-phosphopantetheinyl transferase